MQLHLRILQWRGRDERRLPIAVSGFPIAVSGCSTAARSHPVGCRFVLDGRRGRRDRPAGLDWYRPRDVMTFFRYDSFPSYSML